MELVGRGTIVAEDGNLPTMGRLQMACLKEILMGMVFFVISVSPATANWTRCLGPTGGIVYQLMVRPADPTTVLAASLDGLLKSTDAGSTWTLLNASLADTEQASFVCLAFAPSDKDHLYAGTLRSGIWESTDDGESWSRCLELPGEIRTRCLAIHPNDPQRLLVGTTAHGLYVSADGGRSWRRSDGEWRYQQISALLPLSGEGDPCLVGVWGKGLFIVYGQMETWEKVGTDCPLAYVTVLCPAMTGETLFVGTYGHGLFEGKAPGQFFQPLGDDIVGQEVTDLLVDPWSTGILYLSADGAGVFRTADGGQTWVALNDGLGHRHVYSLAISQDWVYAGTCWGGIYRCPR